MLAGERCCGCEKDCLLECPLLEVRRNGVKVFHYCLNIAAGNGELEKFPKYEDLEIVKARAVEGLVSVTGKSDAFVCAYPRLDLVPTNESNPGLA